MIGGEAMLPTPANIKYANRLIAEIRGWISAGTFRMADYFREANMSAAARESSAQQSCWYSMYGNTLNSWLKSLTLPAPCATFFSPALVNLAGSDKSSRRRAWQPLCAISLLGHNDRCHAFVPC